MLNIIQDHSLLISHHRDTECTEVFIITHASHLYVLSASVVKHNRRAVTVYG